ncbi:uncharacterized protein LOC144706297 [Wolffia australiana]
MEAEKKAISSSPSPLSVVDDAAGVKMSSDLSSSLSKKFPSVFQVSGTNFSKLDVFGFPKTLEGDEIFRDEKNRSSSPAEINGCLFGMSVHYGGKDEYVPLMPPGTTYKADDASVSGHVIPGEWWQGSFYY